MLDFYGNKLEGYCSLEGDKVSNMVFCAMICVDEDDDYCIGNNCDMYIENQGIPDNV